MKQGTQARLWDFFTDAEGVSELAGKLDSSSGELAFLEEKGSQKEEQILANSEEIEDVCAILALSHEESGVIYVADESNDAPATPLSDKKHAIKDVPASFDKTPPVEGNLGNEIVIQQQKLIDLQKDIISKQSENIAMLQANLAVKENKNAQLTALLQNSTLLNSACNQLLEKTLQANAMLFSELSKLRQSVAASAFYPATHPLIQSQSYIPTFSIRNPAQTPTLPTETATPQQRPANN